MNNTKFTEYSLIPFTFEALENGTLTFRDCKDKTNEVLYYKINNLDWVCGNRPLKLTLKAGDTVAFKGNSKKYKFASNSSTIAFTGKHALKGNIMSLVYGDDFLTNTVIPEECFGEHPKKPIWGGISPKAIGEEYVLPEYIIGYVPQHKDKSSEEYYSNRHIEYNQERDRVK